MTFKKKTGIKKKVVQVDEEDEDEMEEEDDEEEDESQLPPLPKPKKQITVNEVLLSHEERLANLEAAIFKIKNI